MLNVTFSISNGYFYPQKEPLIRALRPMVTVLRYRPDDILGLL